jgi:hypothetical protein
LVDENPLSKGVGKILDPITSRITLGERRVRILVWPTPGGKQPKNTRKPTGQSRKKFPLPGIVIE